MVNTMVERATSDRLTAPDLAINIQISDICNHDQSKAKDVIRGIKKRLASKRPKVQLLALALLEAIMKNGVDIVHMHVAEKDLPHEMVKLMRKRPDVHVKEKILILIDTWRESYGGPGARYPQFFVAYQELLNFGEVFPHRPEKVAPNLTPPRAHPPTSPPQKLCNPKCSLDASESSVEDEFPALSLTEIQNARGALDVLSEMLNATTTGNQEGDNYKQEVIIELVERCRTYKQRVVHFVNSSSDESLLRQGLALNDDLQRVLAKHESIVSGATSSQSEKSKLKLAQESASVDAPIIDTGDIIQSEATMNARSVTNNGRLITQDLLSGDDFNSQLAVVSSEDPQPVSHIGPQQSTMALFDVRSPGNNDPSTSSSGQAYTSSPQFQQQPDFQSPQSSSHSNDPPRESHSPVQDAQSQNVFPPPPWENSDLAFSPSQQMEDIRHAQTSQSGTYLSGSQTMENDHTVGMYSQPVTGSIPSSQMSSVYMQYDQMGYMHPQQMYGNHVVGYGYGYAHQGPQQQNAQFLEQSSSGLHVRDDSALRNSCNPPCAPFSKPEDKLFGDLVKDVSKLKPAKAKSSRGGSM